MRTKEGRTPGVGGRATIGDALSLGMKARMAQLREELERRAHAAIQTQLKQPKAPWQTRLPPSSALKRQARPFVNWPIARAEIISPRAQAKAKVLTRHPLAPGGGGKPQPARAAEQARSEPVPFEYWGLPPGASVRETPPASISSQDRASFNKLITAGSGRAEPGSGEELFATIGLDFGTSSTKIIVRLPYEPGAPTIAVPAPAHCRSEGHPYLWHTVLWVRKSGEFIAWPESDACQLHSLKQGIMGGHAGAVVVPNLGGGLGVTREDAATAFLAFVIRYVRGWLLTNRPHLFRSRRPVWFVNVGLPAANSDNPSLVSAYRRVAAAALLLANFDGAVSVETTRLFLAKRQVAATAESAEEGEELGIAAIPETAAEVTGFTKSTNRAPGVYLMVDVGAMTLDVCAFRLVQRTASEDLHAHFAAQVHPLGVEAFHWFLRHGKTEGGFVQQCDHCIREVVWGTKKNRDPKAACWKKGNDLPVFLVGGGARNNLHRRVVEALGPWLREYTQNVGIRPLDLPTPKNIDLPVPVADFGRLAVAWGLSYPPSEIGEVLPPSAIEDIPPAKAIDPSGRFVSKDQV